MLSIQRCRRILGDHAPSTDGEIEKLRDELSALAEIVTDRVASSSSAGSLTDAPAQPVGPNQETETPDDGPGYHDTVRLVDDADRAEIEERAAIMEYDANRPRAEAERFAVIDFCERRARHASRHS